MHHDVSPLSMRRMGTRVQSDSRRQRLILAYAARALQCRGCMLVAAPGQAYTGGAHTKGRSPGRRGCYAIRRDCHWCRVGWGGRLPPAELKESTWRYACAPSFCTSLSLFCCCAVLDLARRRPSREVRLRPEIWRWWAFMTCRADPRTSRSSSSRVDGSLPTSV